MSASVQWVLEIIMEMPEHLRELVDQLGTALVHALATDDSCRELTKQIQAEGFDIGLVIEATVALHRRDDSESPSEEAPEPESHIWPGPDDPPPPEPTEHNPEESWSEADRAFLRTFKISLD